MKANELRLGNLVIDGHDVEVVNYRMIEMLVKNQAEFDPIPLTEEWLLKFGFRINRQTKEDNNIWRCNWSEGYFEVEQIIGFFLWDNHCYGTEIKYVHSLQNLYFALTGEELKLKEDESKTD